MVTKFEIDFLVFVTVPFIFLFYLFMAKMHRGENREAISLFLMISKGKSCRNRVFDSEIVFLVICYTFWTKLLEKKAPAATHRLGKKFKNQGSGRKPTKINTNNEIIR